MSLFFANFISKSHNYEGSNKFSVQIVAGEKVEYSLQTIPTRKLYLMGHNWLEFKILVVERPISLNLISQPVVKCTHGVWVERTPTNRITDIVV